MNGATMNQSRHSLSGSRGRRPHGFSLVELMVAITISLLLLAGVIQIYLASRQTYTLQDGMARLQENARYALNRISQDIARTGYLGCAGPVDVQNHLAIQTGAYNFATPITADDNTGVDGTDILTVRFGSSGGMTLTSILNDESIDATETIPQLNPADPFYDSLEQYDILTVSDCEQAVVFMITNDPTSSGGTIQHAASIVAPSGPNQGQSNMDATVGGNFVLDGRGASLPQAIKTSTAIYLVDASSSGTGNSLYVNSTEPENELIEGVQGFQVQMGLNDDTDLGADRYVDPGNLAANEWNNVVSVRLNLTLDTVEPVQSGTTIAKDFTTTVRLRNRGNVVPSN